MDLALNNRQRLICHKVNQPTNHNSGDLGCVACPCITITSKFTLNRVLSMGLMDMFKNYLYSIGPCSKKPLKKQLYKNVNMNAIPERLGMN